MTTPQLNLGVSAAGIDTVEKLAAALSALYAANEKLKTQAKAGMPTGEPSKTSGLKASDFAKVIAAIQAGSAQQATALAELSNVVKDGLKGFARKSREGFDDAEAGFDSSATKLNKKIRDKTRQLEASYQAMSTVAQRANQLKARAFMDQGFEEKDLKNRFAGSSIKAAEQMLMGSGSGYLLTAETLKIRSAAQKAAKAQREAQEQARNAVLNSVMAFKPDRGTLNTGEASASVRAKQAYDRAQREAENEILQTLPNRSTFDAQSAAERKAAEAKRRADSIARKAAIDSVMAFGPSRDTMNTGLGKTSVEAQRAAEMHAVAQGIITESSKTASSHLLKEANAVRRLNAAFEEMSDKAKLAAAGKAQSFLRTGGKLDDAYKTYGSSAVNANIAELQKRLASLNSKVPVPELVGPPKALFESAREAERRTLAARAEADAIRKLNAAYEAAGPASQLATARRARNFVQNEGGSMDAAKRIYGDKAVGADLTKLEAATAGTTKLRMSMDALHSATRGVASGFNALWMTWSQQLVPLLAGAAVSNAFIQVVKQGSEVNHTFEMMRVLGENTTAQMADLSSTMLSMSYGGMSKGPQEIANAMKILSLAGLDAGKVKLAIKDVLNFSTVGDTDAKTAAETLVAVGTAYGYTADRFGRVGDIIAKSAAMSMASVEGMAASFKYSTVVAEQFGVSLEDMATVLISLSQRGIQGSSAGTAARQFYQELSGANAKVREILKKNDIDVFQTTGAVKPLLQIVEELSGKLDKLSTKDARRLLQDLMNERGGKAGASVLEDYVRGTVKVREGLENAGKASDKAFKSIGELRKEVDSGSLAFNSLNNAALQMTSLNQLKSVKAALQGSFVEAFQSLEPTILRISIALRETFASRGFQQAIQNIAISVGGLTLFLAQHIETIYAVGKAYLVMRAGMVGAGLVFNSIGAWGASATAAGGALAGIGSFLTKLNPILAITSTVVAAGAAAWALFYNNATPPSQFDGFEGYIKTLEEETDRLKARNAELQKGKDLREAEQAVAGMKFREQARQGLGKAFDAKMAAETEASNLSLPQSTVQQITRDQGPAAAARLVQERKDLADGIRNKARAEYAAALAQYRSLEDRANRVEIELRKQSEYKPPTRNALGNQDIKDLVENAKALSGGFGGSDKTFRAFEASLDKELAAIDKNYAARKTIVEASQRARIISEAQTEVQLQMLAEGENAAKLQAIRRFETTAAAEIADIRARALTPGKDGKPDLRALAELQQAQTRLAEVQAELANQTKINSINSIGWYNNLRATSDSAISAAGAWKTAEDEKASAALRSLTLSPKQLAAESARQAAADQYRTAIRGITEKLEEQKAALESVGSATVPYDPEKIATVDAARARIAALTEELNRLKKAQTELGNSAADAASAKFRSPTDNKILENSNWESYGAKAAEDFRAGFQQQSKDLFKNAVLNGKLDFSNMRKWLLDKFADVAFDMAFSGPADGIAKNMFGAVEGVGKLFGAKEGATDPFASAYTATPAEMLEGMWDAFKNFDFKGALSGITDAFQGIDWSKMFTVVKDGLSTAIQFISAMLMSANGNAFSSTGLVTAFANGGSFSNSLVNNPTMFKYGNGRLGVMGEAGPEAIMPLERGPGGKLGVRASGGGGGMIVQRTVYQYNTFAAGVSRSEMAQSLGALRELATRDDLERQRRTPYGAK